MSASGRLSSGNVLVDLVAQHILMHMEIRTLDGIRVDIIFLDTHFVQAFLAQW